MIIKKIYFIFLCFSLIKIHAEYCYKNEFESLKTNTKKQNNFFNVTPDTMPTLYKYISDMCKQHCIQKPSIYITKNQKSLNAYVRQESSINIYLTLEQGLFLEATDEEIEAVIAHELGRIKYRHRDKKNELFLLVNIWSAIILDLILESYDVEEYKKLRELNFFITPFLSFFIYRFIANKKYENQADKFTYAKAQRGKGMVKLLKRLLEKKHSKEKELYDKYNLIQQDKPNVWKLKHALRMGFYYVKKCNYLIFGNIGEIFSWLYHSTPLGNHPSLEYRITVAEEYLAKNVE